MNFLSTTCFHGAGQPVFRSKSLKPKPGSAKLACGAAQPPVTLFAHLCPYWMLQDRVRSLELVACTAAFPYPVPMIP